MSPITPPEGKNLHRELAGMEGHGYWRRLRELAAEAEGADPALWQAPLSRRHALQLLGASMALAGITACSRQPEEHIVPYVEQPEHEVLGQPRYYATSTLLSGYAQGMIARTREGRPVKLEGNPDHPATLGACDAISQAQVLSLYDPDRSGAVRHRNTISDYGALLIALQRRQRQWDASEGQGLCFLTETVTSPSEQALMQALRARWPKSRWFVHDAVDRRSVYAGSKLLFDRPLEPVYRFDRVDRVVTLDGDFLQSQPGFLRYAHDFMARRRPRDVEGEPARLYAITSTPSPTDAVADHRLSLTYPQIENAARQLALALGLEVTPPRQAPLSRGWVAALAADLERHPGRALVVPGDLQPPAVHALAHAINQRLGAYGKTLVWIPPVAVYHDAPPLSALTRAIGAGEVDSLVVLEANPVYTAPADLRFTDAFQRVPWRLHWGSYRDETARLAHWHVPATHPLETWGDARAFDGTLSCVQPLIRPLHGGKTALQMLSALGTGVDAEPRELLRDHWRDTYSGADFESFWRRSLYTGFVADSTSAPVDAQPQEGWTARLPDTPSLGAGLLLQFHPDPALWDGRHANNGWLQEMPRPLTTLTWDNALLINPSLAQRLGLNVGDVVELSNERGKLKIPVFILPGQPDHGVTLHLGQGRQLPGPVARGVGVDAYRLRSSLSPWVSRVTLTPTNEHQPLALIQQHHQMEGRDLVRAATWEAYREQPTFARRPHHELSLYPEPWPAERSASHAWGMTIDLSACIGCNSCVTACQAENNIPVVGPREVARGHEMHWLRVDRYFPEVGSREVERPEVESPEPESPGLASGSSTVFQPVPCMHCENAPCEYVCPVGATLHSADGLNQMIYQRCVGTRYCSQNCPYKVRRFNWFDYTGPDAPYPAEPAVRNPEVTVRTRGVMEKCTYCVQRIQTARHRVEAESRPLADGELQTACQQTCPTQAIVFGDLADPRSQASRLKAHPLNYALLETLNTRPRTTYLAAVNNPNPELGSKGEDETRE